MRSCSLVLLTFLAASAAGARPGWAADAEVWQAGAAKVVWGLALASAVDAALGSAPVPLSSRLSTSLEMCSLEFASLPSRAELEARANSADGFVSRHARWVLKEWPNPGDRPADYRLPVQVVVLGQRLILVALGGEPVVDYSLRLKKELAGKDRLVWVAGCSNLVNAYVPSRRVLLEGGYEGTEAVISQSLPGPFHLDLEERIVGAVHRQARRALEAAESPHGCTAR